MEKIVNRVFALFFFVIVGLWVVWSPIWIHIMYAKYENPNYTYSDYIHPLNFAFLVVLIGLLYEIYRPTLDFELDKNWKWKAVGIFLFIIAAIVIVVAMFWQPYNPSYSILGSRTFEFPLGSGSFHTWPNLLWEFLSTFCMETVSFSLLFGSLFMTKSTPQTSKSYKIMLFGVAAFEVFVFILLYAVFFISGVGMDIYSGLTRTQLLTAYWFHWDFWSELVILISAIWLLKRGKGYSQIRPWTAREKWFFSIFVVLALFMTFVVSPLAMGVEVRKVFVSLIMFALAIAGFILYLKYTEKKKKREL